MFYITTKLPVMYSQMSLEDFMFDTYPANKTVRNTDETATRTIEVESISESYVKRKHHPLYLCNLLEKFNLRYEDLFEKERSSLYRTFYIPKKSGGLRRIDAPNDELKNALRELKNIFEEKFDALYHTNAYAYIKKRGTIKDIKRHTYNQSRWYGKYDLSNFFGSTTKEYVLHMLGMIYPFCELKNDEFCWNALSKALDLAFLNGGLPQGTPLSPLLTNLIMIPVDYKLTTELRDHNKQHFVYTRYADDFIISSVYDFDYKEIESLIKNTLRDFGAPFTINSKKTRYGSSAGANWNLGVMVNSDNEITIGHKKKRQFQAMVSSYIMDYKNGIRWDKSDVQVLDGLRNYYRMVEGTTIDNILNHLGNKFGVNISELIKSDLKLPG